MSLIQFPIPDSDEIYIYTGIIINGGLHISKQPTEYGYQMFFLLTSNKF